MFKNKDIATITDIYIKKSKAGTYWCLMAIIDGEEFLDHYSINYSSIKQSFEDLKAKLPYQFNKYIYSDFMRDYCSDGQMYKYYYLNTINSIST